MQMEFTGERYVPELLSAKISYEHWHRYIFASKFCVHKAVLDVACGEGYGASFLSKRASHVSGIDVSLETITHAKAKYAGSNIDFILSSATSLPFPNAIFDTIVSFETLEHLNSADQELFLAETARVMKPEGVLLISTPNKKVYSDDPNYSNPYHLAEFYKADFEIFLKRYYDNVTIFEQTIIGGSIITMPDDHLYDIDHLHVGHNGFIPGKSGESKDKEYLIAICSSVKLSSLNGSILLDSDNKLITEFSTP